MYDKPVDSSRGPGRPPGKNPETLAAILAYVDGCGYSPSFREIAEAVGVKSPSTVMLYLRELERQGKVGFAGPGRRVYVIRSAA